MTEQTATEEVKSLEITLSKANKIRNLVQAKIADLQTEILGHYRTNIQVDQYTTVDGFTEVREKLVEKGQNLMFKFKALNDVLLQLKNAIAKANADSGITALMNQIEYIRTTLKLAQNATQYVSVGHTLEDVHTVVERNRKTALNSALPENSRVHIGYSNFISKNFSYLTQEEIDTEKAGVSTLELMIRDLEEQRNAKNYQVKLDLDASVVTILKALQII